MSPLDLQYELLIFCHNSRQGYGRETFRDLCHVISILIVYAAQSDFSALFICKFFNDGF